MVSKTLGVASVLGFLFGSVPLASAAYPFGLQIYACSQPGVIAPAFDDGPWIYSESILDRFEAAGIKGTWFLNGRNKGNIYDYNSTLFRMISLGHQIGSHTWSHANLATLTPDGIKSEMTQLEDALVNILGYMPYYMRPPYLSINAQALSVLRELEYYVVIGDLNTRDWDFQTETGIVQAQNLFVQGLDAGYTIIEAHEQEPWTHEVLINFMIKTIVDRNLKTVTVGECMGQSPSEWYRPARQPLPSNASTSALPAPTLVYSLDGTCGNQGAGKNNGWTCPPSGKNCCSKYGSCGNTADYCAPSVCQAQFGKCSSSASSTATTSTPNTTLVPPISGSSTSTGSSPSSSATGVVTPDGTCGNILKGNNNGYVCKPGQCCSKYGNCGTTADYCAASVCQSAFGNCDGNSSGSTTPASSSTSAPASSQASTSSSASPSTSGTVTPDGTCGNILKGNNNGYVCKPGYCCSKYGNCGTTSEYCAASVCQSAFGNCDGSSSGSTSPASSSTSAPASSQASTSSSASPSTSGTVTPDGTCGNILKGNNNGYVCKPGYCCSKYGNCGTTSDYCAASVCQSAFGNCDGSSSGSTSPASSSTSAPASSQASASSSSVPSSSQAPSSTSAPASSQASSSSASPSATGVVTPDGTCGNIQKGNNNGYVCKTGQCCSKYGNCGTTADYCAASVCQSAFGKCDAELPAGSTTPDGTCGNIQKGNNKGYVCKTGACCSKYGSCGTTVDYCGVSNGCQSAFGTCAS